MLHTPDAPCKGQGALFFPPEGVGRGGAVGDVLRVRAAKAICKTCPHTNPCLEYALANDEQGIWGGTTERQRRRIRTDRRAA